ncbi:Integrase zinc binding domain [Popillia japonica]|uniref:RNA-directed DNA polymerase n=1 Tax=Popillia japonica TaxID=7064 RepID=A0AAW1JIQ1_POPJA
MAAYIPGPGETQPWIFEEGLLKHKVGERRTNVVPPAARPQVIQRHHDHYTAGHPGIEETTRAIKQRYFWPGIQPEIANHVRCCRICNAYKRGAHQTPAPLTPHAPLEVISVDVVGPMTVTRTGNRFAIVAQDLYSRWIEAKAVKKATTTATVEFLEEIFQRFGDNGPQFTSIAWEAALRKWQSLHWTTPIYHPRATIYVHRLGSRAKKMAKSTLDHPHLPPQGQPGRKTEPGVEERSAHPAGGLDARPLG